jgi:hypothetical protein
VYEVPDRLRAADARSGLNAWGQCYRGERRVVALTDAIPVVHCPKRRGYPRTYLVIYRMKGSAHTTP